MTVAAYTAARNTVDGLIDADEKVSSSKKTHPVED